MDSIQFVKNFTKNLSNCQNYEKIGHQKIRSGQMREDIKINDRALALEDQIIDVLENVFDTDVELDVYNLGLIYEIHLDEDGLCQIVMTFTDTACDCAESLPIEIVAGLKKIPGIEDVKVQVTWSPAWKITRISRYGRIALGLPPR